MPSDASRAAGGNVPTAPGSPCPLHDQRGVALLVTVLILLVVSILGASVVNLGRVDYALSSNYRSSTAAFSLADSGVSATAADLRADYDSDPADNWLVDALGPGGMAALMAAPAAAGAAAPAAPVAIINGYRLTPARPDPNPYPGVPFQLGGPQQLGSGTYSRIIWLPPVITSGPGGPVVNVRVRSTGVDGSVATPATATVDAVVRIDLEDMTPYSTGAFLGAGDGGDILRGGPVRIAGTVVAIGDPDRRDGVLSWLFSGSRLDLTNGSSIVNNYAGIDDATALGGLFTKLPALAVIELDGEPVQDLGASVHLKDVITFMSRWGGQIGEADVPGNAYKETLDGVYTDDPVVPYTGNLHADATGGSDLSDDLAFPSLSAPYTDPMGGGNYSSFAAYLSSTAFAPVTGGDMTIGSETPSFAWTDPFGKGAIAWDAARETLTIDGIVKINGRVAFGDPDVPGGDSLSAIKYEGTGVLWATDEVTISKDLYPAGSFLEDGPDADDVVDGNLGIISSDEIVIDAGAAGTVPGRGRGRGRGAARGRGRGVAAGTLDDNVQVLATLFAENRLRVETTANVAGAVVTNAIDVDSRSTLNIWHVPSLSGKAAPGMPVGMMIADIAVGIGDWYQRR